jgi:ribosomal protein L7/L12
MDALTLAAIVLAVLAVIVTVVVLRRSWASSLTHSALPLADDRSKPPISYNIAISDPDRSEINALLAGGNKLEAIKRYRQLTGVGLKEAKDYVDALPLSGAIPSLPLSANIAPTAPADLAEVHRLADQGQKIEAIKRYRQLTGVGLKEAKDYVDRL